MAIAFDTSSRTDNPSGGWTHTPVGTPKGVFVFIIQQNSTDAATAVTYGGVAMTELQNALSSTEVGRCQGYFLGDNIPTGAQTITPSMSGTNAAAGFCVTVTAAGDTQVAGIGSAKLESGSVTAPSVTITGISGASYGAGGIFSGIGAPSDIAAGTGMTLRQLGVDFGANSAIQESSTSQNASGDLTIGFLAGTNPAALVGIAIEEIAAAGPANLKSYNTNLKANIKTINTNPIANVKSLNTNV